VFKSVKFSFILCYNTTARKIFLRNVAFLLKKKELKK